MTAPRGAEGTSVAKDSPPENTGRGLWTSAETAQWLTVPERMVRRLVAERRIPYVKVGRYVRFRPQDVKDWRDGQVHPAMVSERRGLIH